MIAHLWQSTIFAIAVAALAFALRSNRAQVRYGLWMTASLKFLLPFAILISLGSHLGWSPAAPRIAAPPVLSDAIARLASVAISQSLPPDTILPTKPVELAWFPLVFVALWFCGAVTIASIRLRNWLPIRRAIRASGATNVRASVAVRRSRGLLEPGVVGLIRPIILLPEGIEESLSPAQFDAILTHELCHARRRDNLFAAIHMVVETLFWFHPFVWWIGARLLLERERACDEEVLRAGTQPETYADAILNVCKLCDESPLACISGVGGADLKTRIHAVLSGPVARDLSFAKKAVLVTAAVGAIGLPVLIGASNPSISMQALSPSAQHFRNVSITSCINLHKPPTIKTAYEGHLVLDCVVINSLIQLAWDRSMPDFRRGTPILGKDPVFAMADRYNIDAQADPSSTVESMEGPMVQALLAERFGLKVHKETHGIRMYSLMIAKSGTKLTLAKESACAPLAVSGNMSPPPPLPGGHPCRTNLFKGSYAVIADDGSTLAEFSSLLGTALRTTVVDKTGISGSYAFHLKYAVNDTPSLLNALYPPLPKILEDQFGLKLEPFAGTHDYFVIDRVERPSLN